MSLRNACLCLLALACQSHALAQEKSELLGSPDAIVLDLGIDEERNYLVAATNTEVQLWNYKKKTLISSWAGQSVHSIELNSNFLAGISRSNQLFVWDITSGQDIVHSIGNSPLSCLTWVDSASVIVGNEEGSLYRVNIKTGNIESNARLDDAITALAISNDNTLAVGVRKDGLKLYDPLALTLIKSTEGNQENVSVIIFADSSGHFKTVSDNKFVSDWKMTDLSGRWEKHPGSRITSMDYMSEAKGGSIIAVGRLNGDILITTQVAHYLGKAKAIVNEIALMESELPAIKFAVATHGAGIQLWDAKQFKYKSN